MTSRLGRRATANGSSTAPVVIVTLVLSFALPVGSTHASAAAEQFKERRGHALEQRRGHALKQLGKVDRVLGSRSLSDILSSAAGLGGLRAHENPTVVPAVRRGRPGPDLELSQPVARLLGAIESAHRQATSSVDVSKLALVSAFPSSPPSDTLGTESRARLVEVNAAVDSRSLVAAALGVARVIDESLPILRAATTSSPQNGGSVLGCEVADNPPVLCIGGEQNNTYEDDYALQIDLGGDDLYQNSAGGASPLAGQQPVAVVLDIDGDDTYSASLRTSATPTAAQGSGVLGGLGFLVDLAGDDSYTAEGEQNTSSFYAQGAAQGGVGIRVDFEGSDKYEVSSSAALDNVVVSAQGAADTGGLAVAFDGGNGDDTYLVRTQPARLGLAVARGFGSGDQANALWADEGGSDTIVAEAMATAAPVGGSQGIAYLTAFGVGANSGNGVALAGEGPTEWIAKARTVTPQSGRATLLGFGFGFRGLGAVHDGGGDDAYVAEAIVEATSVSIADESCDCSQAKANSVAGEVVMHSQAIGLGGIGVLKDGGGNDRYQSTAASVASSEARDDRAAIGSEQRGAVASATSSGVQHRSQGTAAASGIGLLIDLGGDDLYHSESRSTAEAHADAVAAGATRSARAYSNTAYSKSQAYGETFGYGELSDAGGNDSYVSRNISTAIADPPTDFASQVPTSDVQAAVRDFGLAFFSDMSLVADVDTFIQAPESPACFGTTRGDDAWVACGGAGGGINPSP